MSESGKVSLPTPERIEEIKAMITAMKGGLWSEEYEMIEQATVIIPELSAALEESQQQNKRLEVKLQASRDSVYPISVERDEYKVELAEAQQTIARLKEREQSIIYEVSEIHKEAAAGNSGSLERADTALNRIMLLSSNLLALGNKEGSDKA